MAALIIIRGNSGSGKTSLAVRLRNRLSSKDGNVLLISQDNIRREMLCARDGENTSALPLLEALLEYGKNHCETVILEGILNARWYKPLFELAVSLFGENISAYYYDIPFDETVRRHGTREMSHSFGEEEMKLWWNEKDFLSSAGIHDIDEKLFSSETSLDAAESIILSDIYTKKHD